MLFAACVVAEPSPEPTAYLADPPVIPPPTLDGARLSAALDRLVPQLLTTHAGPLLAAYDGMMAHAEGPCPDVEGGEDGAEWYDRCTTAGGASFDGYGFRGEVWEDDGETSDHIHAMYGVASIAGGGRSLTLGGYASTLEGTTVPAEPEPGWTGEAHFYTHLSGSFRSDDPALTGTFLDSGGDLRWEWWIARYFADDARLVSLSGDRPLDDPDLSAVAVTDLFYLSESLGGCGLEPGGQLSFRGLDGLWYDLVLHGPTDWGEAIDTARCDGCGDLWYEGAILGEACADWRPLWDWGESPW